MKNIAASFNVLDPDELNQYQHVKKRKNVSRYIKMLIQRDMDNNYTTKVIYNAPVFAQKMDPNNLDGNDDIDDDLMKDMI
jgi:hypothetical protein